MTSSYRTLVVVLSIAIAFLYVPSQCKQEDAPAGFEDVTDDRREQSIRHNGADGSASPYPSPGGELPNRWEQKAHVGGPPPRLAHAVAAVADRYVYIFGGTYGSAALSIPYVSYSDMWVYDEPFDTWTQITQLGDLPPARLHASLVTKDDDTLLLFGGFNVFQGEPGHTGLNDFYKFTISTKTWVRLDTTIIGAAPSIRGAHGSEYFNGVMYIFGGFPAIAPTGHLREFWKYDDSSMRWTQIPLPAHSSPEGRIGFALEAVGPDTLLITTGGCSVVDDVDGQCDLLWTYTVSADTWTRIEAHGPFQRRATGATSAVGSFLYQFGGFYMDGKNPPRVFGDLHVLNTVTWEWEELETGSPTPDPTFGHSFARVGKRIVMFGGRTNSPAQPGSSNTWEYTAY
jgi:N-acetylneuraminic acid mutarotase